MTGQLGLLPPTANELRAEETDTAERSDDPTPRGVIRAVLSRLFSLTVDPRQDRLVTQVSTHWYPKDSGLYSASAVDVTKGSVRVLDVCAGHGAWASEMRRLAQLQGWPVHITGVELHAPREPDLRKWCDVVIIRDYFDALRDHHELPQFDIIIGNPHFPALTGALTPGDDFGEHTPSMPEVLLEHAPAVLLLHTQQAFLKSEAGRAAWRRCPPAASWLVPGSVKFRSGTNLKCPKCGHVNTAAAYRCEDYDPNRANNECGAKLKKWGADSRCYAVSLWLRGHTGPTSTHLLDDLPASARAWVVAPGSEQPSADLPAAPGWTP